jgi:hypothetical protein
MTNIIATSKITFPPLPSQPSKSLEERLSEADLLSNILSRGEIKAIKSKIRKSERDCGQFHIVVAPPCGLKKINDIQKLVALHFNVRVIDILSKCRTRNVIIPRHISMYLCMELTPRSLPEIGRLFGGRHHTTVLHAVRKIARLVDEDAALAEEISALKEMLLA